RHQTADRRRARWHPGLRPAGCHQAGVPRTRRSPQHDEPRRLGQDLGEEGRADRLRPHPGRGNRREPAHREGLRRPVPLMAQHKVLGTETEYGIVVRGDPTYNPAVASSLVVNSYPGKRVKVQWSYEEESPGRDARGSGHDTYGIADPEGAVVNSV